MLIQAGWCFTSRNVSFTRLSTFFISNYHYIRFFQSQRCGDNSRNCTIEFKIELNGVLINFETVHLVVVHVTTTISMQFLIEWFAMLWRKVSNSVCFPIISLINLWKTLLTLQAENSKWFREGIVSLLSP